jgi:hypothetical protein
MIETSGRLGGNHRSRGLEPSAWQVATLKTTVKTLNSQVATLWNGLFSTSRPMFALSSATSERRRPAC